MKVTRLFIFLLVGMLLTIVWTPAWAKTTPNAEHPFISAAQTIPELNAVLEKYLEMKEHVRQSMITNLLNDNLGTDDDIEDQGEKRAKWFDGLGEPLQVQLTAFRATADSVAKSRGDSFRKAMEEWFAAEQNDLDKVRQIGSMIYGTIVELNTWEYLYNWVKIRKLDKEATMHKQWAVALSLSYTSTQYELAKQLAPKNYTGHAALFAGIVWGATNMEETLTFMADNLEAELSDQNPRELIADRADKAGTLIDGVDFFDDDWRRILLKGKDHIKEEITEVIDAYDRYVTEAQPYIDGTLLHKIGAPFKDLAFEDISEAFGELYGEVVARSRE